MCFFGIYNPEYARNRVLRNAFEKNGYDVVDCRVDPRKYKGLSKYVELAKQWKKIGNSFDYVLVCYPGQSVVWLAWLLSKNLLIFDAFLSLYDSNVFDRKIYSKFQPKAFYDWFLDWYSIRLAEWTLLDTYEHINYFVRTFKVKKEKFIRVPISADEYLFTPREINKTEKGLLVHFHGMFIPLQGVKYIIEAAQLLKNEDIYFQIVGSGQEFEYIKDLVLKNKLEKVKLFGKVALSEVPNLIAKSNICLGIFGDTEKTLRVIPNKVYEYAAMGKPIITADSPALREIFNTSTDVLVCPTKDGAALAESILYLSQNKEKSKSLGKAARRLFETKLNAASLGKELIKNLNVI